MVCQLYPKVFFVKETLELALGIEVLAVGVRGDSQKVLDTFLGFRKLHGLSTKH